MLLLIVITIFSFLMTFAVMPWFIHGLKIHGVLVRDYYKFKKTYIPREGGIILLFACALMVTIFPLIIYFTRRIITIFDISVGTPYLLDFNYFVVLVILTFGIFGMMDDYLDIGRPIKVILPILFITPLIFTLDPTEMVVVCIRCSIFIEFKPSLLFWN